MYQSWLVLFCQRGMVKMFRITWKQGWEDCSAIVSNAEMLWALYWALTGYGRHDGCKPSAVKCWDLQGNELPMSEGIAAIAARGSR